MVNLKYLKSYCRDYEHIQNYEDAIKDTENVWECHHKLEAFFTKQELKDMGRYYHVPPRELVLCRNRKEHLSYPHKGMKIMGLKHHGLKFTEEALLKISPKGRKLSEETKRKISNARKGKKRPNLSELNRKKKGTHLSEETRLKISLAHKGKKRNPPSKETRRKISESNKGKIAWNKGLTKDQYEERKRLNENI